MDRTDVILAEYTALKTEQNDRIKARDALPYAAAGAVVTAIAGAVAADAPMLLLLLAPVGAVLGWTKIATDEKVTAIGRYLREVTAPALAELTDAPALEWETTHRFDPRRRQRHNIQAAADLLTFAGPGIGGVIAWWALDGSGVLGNIAAYIAAAVMLVLIVQIHVYAREDR